MRYELNAVEVNGFRTYYLTGSATIALTASGHSEDQLPVESATIPIVMSASGVLTKCKNIAGSASIAMSADGVPAMAIVPTLEAASIVISARHGMPDPMNPPAQFYPARDENVIEVDEKDDAIVVPAPDKTVAVDHGDRTIVVERETE